MVFPQYVASLCVSIRRCGNCYPTPHYTPVTLLQPEPARMMIRVLHLRLSRTGGI